MRRKGEAVIDLPTNILTRVVSVNTQYLEGRKAAFYLLDDNIPLSPNYPTRWRSSNEILSPHHKSFRKEPA